MNLHPALHSLGFTETWQTLTLKMSGRVYKAIFLLFVLPFLCDVSVCGAALSQQTSDYSCPICKLLNDILQQNENIEAKIDLLLEEGGNCSQGRKLLASKYCYLLKNQISVFPKSHAHYDEVYHILSTVEPNCFQTNRNVICNPKRYCLVFPIFLTDLFVLKQETVLISTTVAKRPAVCTLSTHTVNSPLMCSVIRPQPAGAGQCFRRDWTAPLISTAAGVTIKWGLGT